MEDMERTGENEEGEWDWEVLADDNSSDHHQQQQQQKSSSSDGDGGGGGGGGSGSGVICSDYFSLEFNSPPHLNNTDSDSEGVNTDIHMDMDMNTDMDTDKDSSGSTTSSWVDPPEPQLANNSNTNGGSSGVTSGCSSDSDSSTNSNTNGKLLEKLLQPHSTCDSSHHLHLPPLPLEPKDADDNTHTHATIQDGTPIPSPPNNKAGWAWWKVPLQVLKYCVFRVNPVSVWSLSFAAAAVMGFFLLRRTWFSKIKRKTPPGIALKLTVDDKKVSQFMSRASRLNEAFSVVKRVPIIRPAFPAPGLAPWPAMSLR